MKDRTLYLEAAREENVLKIGVHERYEAMLDPSLDPYDVKEIPLEKMTRIEKMCLETISMHNSLGRGGDVNGRLAERLRKMGDVLCDELLTYDVKEKLSLSDARFLILRIDDNMVQIPWELICLDGRFLCERFNLGRLVRTRQKISSQHRKLLTYPIDMWVLANPNRDLSSADTEGSLILRLTDTVNPDDLTIINASLDSSNVTLESVCSRIKQADIVHFAGHAEYDAKHPSESGWKISDRYFSVHHIDQMAGSSKMPAIVFSNACHSARTEQWQPGNDSFGLANAFLRAGVTYYIGTFWEVLDEPSTLFACEFYTFLFSGKSIGEAVRRARMKLKQSYGDDYAGWAGYLLYGDPRYRLFEAMTEKQLAADDYKNSIGRENTLANSFRGTLSDKLHVRSQSQRPFFNAGAKISRVLLSGLGILCVAYLGIMHFNTQNGIEKEKLKYDVTFKEKKRNDTLVDRISRNYEAPEQQDVFGVAEEKAHEITIAVVHDAFAPKTGSIAAAMKRELKKRLPEITFVERQDVNALLEEINLASSLPTKQQLNVNFLPSRLILKITATQSFSETTATVHMIDTQTGESIFQETGVVKGRNAMPDQMITKLVGIVERAFDK